MTLQTLIAVLIFSTVMAFTPGPNNAMLASSGSRFGLARTLPHAAGVTLGFPVMIFLVGIGLASILLASPLLQLAMKSVSCAYLLWMAFQIARSDSTKESSGRDKPLTFLQAAAFQWINPKAWLMAVGAISAYTTGKRPAVSRSRHHRRRQPGGEHLQHPDLGRLRRRHPALAAQPCGAALLQHRDGAVAGGFHGAHHDRDRRP